MSPSCSLQSGRLYADRVAPLRRRLYAFAQTLGATDAFQSNPAQVREVLRAIERAAARADLHHRPEGVFFACKDPTACTHFQPSGMFRCSPH
jgi:hypothetical protein